MCAAVEHSLAVMWVELVVRTKSRPACAWRRCTQARPQIANKKYICVIDDSRGPYTYREYVVTMLDVVTPLAKIYDRWLQSYLRECVKRVLCCCAVVLKTEVPEAASLRYVST